MLKWVGLMALSHHENRGQGMHYFIGIDVSLKDSSVCVLDQHGGIVREAQVVSVPPPDPETPNCVYAASGSMSIWSRRNWAGERWPCRSISQCSL